ncbi:MAG TPA: phosphoglycerate dehydrogenase-like oxidoreductase, partial [Dehalococcoidia bacterium]|nr:phosphoglycerate dehydrogenase-like oxidoreductase [Dehalococcoidia bacterium]
FASGCDVLTCHLPLTEETKGIVDYRLLNAMNRGGCVINAARGDHMVEGDIVHALNENILSFAFLDVFTSEPLPPDSPLWGHENVMITYHSAAYIGAELGARIIADNIRSFEIGSYEGPRYDAALGY